MISPGSYVECVDASPPYAVADFSGHRLRLGALYWVDRVDLAPFACWHCGSHEAVIVAGCDDAWCSHRFSPVYKPKRSFIETLKRPAPELEPA